MMLMFRFITFCMDHQTSNIIMFVVLCMCQQQQRWHSKQTYSKAPPTSGIMCVYNFLISTRIPAVDIVKSTHKRRSSKDRKKKKLLSTYHSYYHQQSVTQAISPNRFFGFGSDTKKGGSVFLPTRSESERCAPNWLGSKWYKASLT